MSYKVTRANEAYKYDAAGHYDVQKTGDRKQGTQSIFPIFSLISFFDLLILCLGSRSGSPDELAKQGRLTIYGVQFSNDLLTT